MNSIDFKNANNNNLPPLNEKEVTKEEKVAQETIPKVDLTLFDGREIKISKATLLAIPGFKAVLKGNSIELKLYSFGNSVTEDIKKEVSDSFQLFLENSKLPENMSVDALTELVYFADAKLCPKLKKLADEQLAGHVFSETEGESYSSSLEKTASFLAFSSDRGLSATKIALLKRFVEVGNSWLGSKVKRIVSRTSPLKLKYNEKKQFVSLEIDKITSLEKSDESFWDAFNTICSLLPKSSLELIFSGLQYFEGLPLNGELYLSFFEKIDAGYDSIGGIVIGKEFIYGDSVKAVLEAIEKFNQIHSFTFFTDKDSSSFRKDLPQLNQILSKFQQLKKLEIVCSKDIFCELNLRNKKDIALDSLFKYISELKSLESLSLEHLIVSDYLSDESFLLLSQLKELKSLSLEGSLALSKYLLKLVEVLPSYKKLELLNLACSELDKSDEAVYSLLGTIRDLPSLKSLRLDANNLDSENAFLWLVNGLAPLEKIHLSQIISPFAFKKKPAICKEWKREEEPIAKKTLRLFFKNGFPANPEEFLKLLTTLPNLSCLSLPFMGSKNLSYLEKIAKLEILYLEQPFLLFQGEVFDDESARKLNKLKHLKNLHILFQLSNVAGVVTFFDQFKIGEQLDFFGSYNAGPSDAILFDDEALKEVVDAKVVFQGTESDFTANEKKSFESFRLKP